MILLIGFPKSGTTSFDTLFRQLGYTTYHWKKGSEYIGTLIRNNKRNGRPLLTGFAPDDCITQMDVCISSTDCYWPQFVDLEQLYNENKGAIFILNKRAPVKILQSFKKWNDYNGRLYRYNPELIADKTDTGFLEFVVDHYSRVETFFVARPGAKFVTYDIEADTLDKLGCYIDLKGITKFPFENKNPRRGGPYTGGP